MTLNQKVDIYKKLVAGLAKGVKLAAVLDRLGATDERKKVEGRNAILAKQAETLRTGIHRQWSIQAGATLEKIRTSSAKLQGQIRSIEETRRTGEKVVKALGYVDELIDIAKTVAKAMA